MSADADRCALCGLGRVTDPLCRERRCMPSIEELRPTSPDRIAQLEAELAEARGIPRQCASLGHTQSVGGFCLECSPHRTPMDRLDAAQQRASSAQKELERLAAAHERTKADFANCADVGRRLEARLNLVLGERDAAQAEAAAMREVAIKAMKSCGVCHGAGEYWPHCYRCDDSTEDHDDCPPKRKCDQCAALRERLGTAGRDLAARVTLLEAVVRFLDAWSQWGLNDYVCTDVTTRTNLRALRDRLGLGDVDGGKQWVGGGLYREMITAREKLAALGEKGGGA